MINQELKITIYGIKLVSVSEADTEKIFVGVCEDEDFKNILEGAEYKDVA